MRRKNSVRHPFSLTMAVAGLMSVAGLLLQAVALAQQPKIAPSWTITGSLNTAREGYTATLLPNGKVLVAGGTLARFGLTTYSDSAELYDPATGTWSYTGNLNVGRTRHTATLLSNGKVLVVGGEAGADQVTSTSELYDPATETWSSTGQTHCAGTGHTATLLPNGKVLVAGSFGGIGSCNIGELYDPATGNWRTTGSLNTGRALHTATLLPSGKVLVAGGLEFVDSLNTAELYDPATETWSATGNFNTGRSYHSAILLPSGKVLVAGGEGHIGDASNPVSSAELYDPASGTWSVTGNLNTARGRRDTATLLLNDQVLIAGAGRRAELYDPSIGTWSSTADLNSTDSIQTTTLLLNGKVLATGLGGEFFTATSTAELYDPPPAGSTFFVPVILSSVGAGGSFFTSEIALANRSTQNATVEFTYTAAFGGGSGLVTDTLEAGKQRIAPDAIAYLRQRGMPLLESGSRGGTLRIRIYGLSSPDEAAVIVRTTTAVPDGRAGLAYPGLPPNSLLEGPAYLFGLRQNASDRTNVALQNVGASQGFITLRVTVHSGDANAPFSKQLPDVVLPPGGFQQINNILAADGLSVTNGDVRIERVSGTAPYYAYAVINDQLNSDGSFVPPILENSLVGRTKLTLPVVVETDAFTTEVVASNWSATKKALRCRYVADAIGAPDTAASFTIELNAREQLILPDFVQRLRENSTLGIGPKGPSFVGAMFAEVTSGDLNGISLAARTAAPGAGGRYGVFYEAVPSGMASTTSSWIFGLQQSAETRSNLALVNTGETDDGGDVFRIELFDGDTGVKASTFETMVNAKAWKQIGTVLAQYAPETTQGYARVTRIAGNNPFIAYAVVNDGGQPGQRTGDGAFVASAP
jgi:galactose oxidase-like protein/Kelch motif protein